MKTVRKKKLLIFLFVFSLLTGALCFCFLRRTQAGEPEYAVSVQAEQKNQPLIPEQQEGRESFAQTPASSDNAADPDFEYADRPSVTAGGDGEGGTAAPANGVPSTPAPTAPLIELPEEQEDTNKPEADHAHSASPDPEASPVQESSPSPYVPADEEIGSFIFN